MAAHSRNLGGFSYAVNIDSAVLIAQAEAAAKAATPLVGEYIKQESNAIAPLRDGTLIGASRVESQADSAIVVYGGVIYAAYQHEGEDFHHPNGRQAKYLESIMQSPATAQAVRDIFAAQLQNVLGR